MMAQVCTRSWDGNSPLDGARSRSVSSCQLLVAYCAPLPTVTHQLRALGLPNADSGYLAAIRNAGWKRRVAAFQSYIYTNGKWW